MPNLLPPLQRDSKWVLSNDAIEVTVDPDHGGDITSIVHRTSETEVLWRSFEPRGAPPSDDSAEAFYDNYRGGIQDLFPNAGPPTVVAGARLPFHGELRRARWSVLQGRGITLITHLARFPFRVTKSIWLDADEPVINIEISVKNTSAQDMPTHWGFHPAFSESLTGPVAELIGPFSSVASHPGQFGNRRAHEEDSPVDLEDRWNAKCLVLNSGNGGTADLDYAVCDGGWFILRSTPSNLSVVLTWPVTLFPRLWIWQECKEAAGYPWFGRHHIVGIEPHTSSPVQALSEEVDRGDQLTINGGQSVDAHFSIRVDNIADEDMSAVVQSLTSAASGVPGSTGRVN